METQKQEPLSGASESISSIPLESSSQFQRTLTAEPPTLKRSLIFLAIANFLFILFFVVLFAGLYAVGTYLSEKYQLEEPTATENTQNTTQALCTIEDTPQDAEDRAKLTELNDKINALYAKLPASGEGVSPSDEAALREAEARYDALSDVMAKRQIEAVSEEEKINLYKDYCGGDTLDSGKVDDSALSGTSPEFIQSTSRNKFADLSCNLKAHNYTDSQIPTALYYVGQKLLQGGDFDGSFAFFKCAGGFYYEPTSMMRVAQIYTYGTSELQKDAPDIKIETPVASDAKKAMFWLSAFYQTRYAQHAGMINANTETYTTLQHLQATLLNGSSLSLNDLQEQQQKALDFVSKGYPTILEDHAALFSDPADMTHTSDYPLGSTRADDQHSDYPLGAAHADEYYDQ